MFSYKPPNVLSGIRRGRHRRGKSNGASPIAFMDSSSPPDVAVYDQEDFIAESLNSSKQTELAKQLKRESVKLSQSVSSSSVDSANGHMNGSSMKAENTSDADEGYFMREKMPEFIPTSSSLRELIAREYRGMNVHVYLNFDNLAPAFRKKPITLNINSNDTVLDLISTLIEHCKKENICKVPHSQPEGYVLYMADEIGEPEEGFAAFDTARVIKQTGTDSFVLCQAKGYISPSTSEGSSYGSPNLKFPTRTSALEDIAVQVILPQSHDIEYVMVAPDVLLKDLLDVVADHFGLSPTKYSLTEVDPEGRERELKMSDMVRTMRSLTVSRVKLKKLANIEDSPNAKEEVNFEGPVFFSEFSASQYKEYDVIKVNKYGMRQERCLGIDRDKIYNTLPRHKRPFGKKANTKKPERNIEDIEDLYIVEEKPNCFCVKIEDSDSSFETLFYESEIVAKLQYLRALKRPEVGVSQPPQVKKFEGDKFVSMK